jgi:hypothetical protein
LKATGSAGFGALTQSNAPLWQAALAGAALLVAVGVAVVIARQLGGPVADLSAVCDALANSVGDVAIPPALASTKCGALARSMALFQDAVRRNGGRGDAGDCAQRRNCGAADG